MDCEDPPSLIPDFLAEHDQGYAIDYGKCVDREEPAALLHPFPALAIYLLPFWLITMMIAQLATGTSWAVALMIWLASVYIGTTLAFSALYIARNYKNSLGQPIAFISRRDTRLEPHSVAG